MKTRIVKPRRLFPLLLGLALQGLSMTGTQASPSTEWQSTEFNCRLDLPEGWRQLTPPNEKVKLLAQNDDATRQIMLAISSELLRGPVSIQEGIRGARDGIGEKAGTVLAERDLTLHGMPAFEMVARIPQEGSQLYMKCLYIWADGRLYALSGISFSADVAQDREISEVLASFAFLRPPKSPSLPGSPGITAYKMGKLIGTVLGWFAIAAGAFYLIRKLFRKPIPPKG